MSKHSTSVISVDQESESQNQTTSTMLLPRSQDVNHKVALAERQPLSSHIQSVYPKEVLTEEQYIDNMEFIIARDYFPDALPEGLDKQKKSLEDGSIVCVKDMSLEGYLSHVTSEDNTSATNLLLKEGLDRRQQQWWMREGIERNRVREALGGVRSAVEDAQNNVMFPSHTGTKAISHAITHKPASGVTYMPSTALKVREEMLKTNIAREAELAGEQKKTNQNRKTTQAVGMLLDGGYNGREVTGYGTMTYKNSLNVAGLKDAFAPQQITSHTTSRENQGRILKENTRFPVDYVLSGEVPSKHSVPNPGVLAQQSNFESLLPKHAEPVEPPRGLVKQEQTSGILVKTEVKVENRNMVSTYNNDSEDDEEDTHNTRHIHLQPTLPRAESPPRKKVR